MVKGLDRFREQFTLFSDSYVLIGGVACLLAMEEAGLLFRTTKDLDIVLCVEALNDKFVKAFWEFIIKGNYQYRQKSTGRKLFYRFHSPEDSTYPEMLELFSRKPEAIKLSKNSHLTPIPVDEEISSLSAILLDEDYYRFIHAGKYSIEGLSVVAPGYLIPLKARAWLDLSERSNIGALVDRGDIRKHKNDVLRLYQLLSAEHRMILPQSIKADMRKFIEHLKNCAPIDLKDLGIKNIDYYEMMQNFIRIYDL